MDKNHNPSWANGTLDEAINLLATTAVAAREKRAFNPLGALQSNVVTPLTDSINSGLGQAGPTPAIPATGNAPAVPASSGSEIGKHLAWSLLGGGAGAALGLGSQMFEEPHKRKSLSSMVTGGLLGATAGGAGSLVHEHIGDLMKPDKKPANLPTIPTGITDPFGNVIPTAAIGATGAADAAGTLWRRRQMAQNPAAFRSPAELRSWLQTTQAKGPEIDYLRTLAREQDAPGLARYIAGEMPRPTAGPWAMPGAPAPGQAPGVPRPLPTIDRNWVASQVPEITPWNRSRWLGGSYAGTRVPRAAVYPALSAGAAALPLLNEWLMHSNAAPPQPR